MNIVSFSLWGDKPIYCEGAIKNVSLVKEIYEGWEMYVYYDNTVPKKYIDQLNSLGVTTIDVTDKNMYGMFWRFLANDVDGDGYSIYRDCDSRVSLREKLAVDEWIESGKSLHVMRDHPGHAIAYGSFKKGILGGMWGSKRGIFNIEEKIKNYSWDNSKYGDDQKFLHDVYKEFELDMLEHDEFGGHNNFPIKRDNYHFIGERFDENNNRFNDYLTIKNG